MKAESQAIVGDVAPLASEQLDSRLRRWIASVAVEGVTDTLAYQIVNATHGHLGTGLIPPKYLHMPDRIPTE